MRLVWDYDYIKYSIASAGEKRTIDVVHKSSGNIKSFDNRTAFYGHWKTKSGGWLGDLNASRISSAKQPFKVDDFDIIDKQTAEPVEFILSSVKHHIENIVEKLGASYYYGYIGKGDSFRVGKSTILKYKGNRDASTKPIHLEAVENYLIEHHRAKIIEGIEVDDKVVIDCLADKRLTLVGEDKDYMGCDISFFNYAKMDAPQLISGFGELYIDSKNTVRGWGYIFWLFQVMYGDSSDNYYAHSASDVKWGEKSAYKLLENCRTEKEAWEKVIQGYKMLYPSPKTIKGWRGDEIVIDWRYVLNENCIMAKMMTSENYVFDLASELDTFGVAYEDA